MFLLLLLTFVLQEFVPAIPLANHTALVLPAVFFFAAAAAAPFPMMLMMAFVTGLLWDARYLPLPTPKPSPEWNFGGESLVDATSLPGGELGFGVSIILFVLLGTLMQGIRPLFTRGRLELPVLMVGISMAAWVTTQFLLITFMRGGFSFSASVWSKIITQSLLSMLVSPVIFLVLHGLANLTRYEIRYEGLRYNFHGR